MRCPQERALFSGGLSANPTARIFWDQIPSMRFRFDLSSNEYLIDTHTGTVFEPMFKSIDGTSFELVRDYGLLTISRIGGAKHGREESLVIAAMGVHAPGTAAVFSCLLSPEYMRPIIADARRVIEGAAETAQWVVPCDGCSTPLISEISIPRRCINLFSTTNPAASRSIPVSAREINSQELPFSHLTRLPTYR